MTPNKDEKNIFWSVLISLNRIKKKGPPKNAPENKRWKNNLTTLPGFLQIPALAKWMRVSSSEAALAQTAIKLAASALERHLEEHSGSVKALLGEPTEAAAAAAAAMPSSFGLLSHNCT